MKLIAALSSNRDRWRIISEKLIYRVRGMDIVFDQK